MANSSSSSSCLMVFLALFLFAVAVGAHIHDGYISPALSPYTDKICDDVECGKGKCIVDLAYHFNFRCECDAGWKRARYDDNELDFYFLPCTIPNCSLDYSCMPAAPPAPAIPYNASRFDPCYWTYCGEGTCKRNTPYRHTCECSPGYYNLNNISFYPCYSECALGSDCERLGVRVSNSTSSSTSGNNDSQAATSFLPGNFYWMSISLVSIILVLWN